MPIGPNARHYALENNWKIQTLGSLWSNKEYFRAKEDSENRIKTLVRELNEYSKSVSKNFLLTIGDYFHFQLHIVIGQIHYNKFIIDSIQKSLSPESWVLYQQKQEKIFMDFRPNPKTIFYDIFSLSPFSVKGELIKLNMERKENKHIESRQSWKQALKSILPKRIIEKLIILRYKNKNNWFSIGKKRLLLIGYPNEWASVLSNRRFKKILFRF